MNADYFMGFVVCQTKLNPDSDDPDNQLALDNCQLLRVCLSLKHARTQMHCVCAFTAFQR